MADFFEIQGQLRVEIDKLFESQMTNLPRAQVAQGEGRLIFRRNPDIKGTMGAFGYDYFTDKYGSERARALRLPRYQGLRGSGGEYTYEVLNFVDGKRNVQQIRDAVSAEFGPVPVDVVLEYLRALESINVVQIVK